MTNDEAYHQSILVLGLGIEGISSLRFLLSRIPIAEFGIADQRPFNQLSSSLHELINGHPEIKIHCGENYLSSIQQYDIIVKSAGISIHSLHQKGVLTKKQKIITHTSLFFDHCQGTIIGVTGTKGKSTTASLIYAILKETIQDVHLIGNIGVPALDALHHDSKQTIYIYELSSYQLETLQRSPHIAVFLNIMEEHLDYHGSFDAYLLAKLNITKYQQEQDYFIYNKDYPILQKLVTSVSLPQKIPFSITQSLDWGYFLEANTLIERLSENTQFPIIQKDDIPLIGQFNLYNILAAIAVARIYNVPAESIQQAISTFTPLEHRLEYIGTYRGIRFYNDSISTVPQCTIQAMEALGKEVKTLIIGGHDRGIDYSELAHFLCKQSLQYLILFPETGQTVWRLMKSQKPEIVNTIKIMETQDMEKAVQFAFQHTGAREICLLSPAASSYGLFRDFQERGNRFKQLVRELGDNQ